MFIEKTPTTEVDNGPDASAISAALHLVLSETQRSIDACDPNKLSGFIKVLEDSPRVFVLGEGRSGLVAKMFAMRLMHLGMNAWVVGETTSPSIQKGDALVVVTGSGSGACLRSMVESSHALGVRILCVTATGSSPISATAEETLLIEAATKTDASGNASKQFAGSLFEQTSLLALDALFYVLAGRSKQTAAELYQRHTNLE